MATAAAVAESRSELLNWANDLLRLNMTKIEQFGTGAAHCQLIDSIYGTRKDLPDHHHRGCIDAQGQV